METKNSGWSEETVKKFNWTGEDGKLGDVELRGEVTHLYVNDIYRDKQEVIELRDALNDWLRGANG